MSSTQDSAQKAGTAVTGGIAKQNPSAEMQGTSNSVKLATNCIYEGIVVRSSVITRLIDVNVNGAIIEGCQMMCGAVGAFVGVQDVAIPSAGASVLVAHCSGGDYVLGGQLTVKDSNKTWSPPVTGDIEYDVVKKSEPMKVRSKAKKVPVTSGLKMPIDMFPGEWEKTSGIGPALRLLFNFAQMDSGSLAKIETHLMNDMVRIVDNYFAHHHVGGDELIWSNEYNTWESHFTQYPHEAEGKTSKSEPLAEKSGKAFDPKSKCEPDEYNATGRWRKSTYIGFLGDMIHTWVTHPTEVASSYMDGAKRATNFRQWIGTDGTYMVQAGGGLQIEAGGKPICPEVLHAWNDPNLKLKDVMQSLDSSFLKIWGKGPEWEDLKVSCWQMRSYLRYIPLWHSLARWKQLEAAGFCRIPAQEEAPQGNPGADEEDRKEITGEEPYKGYAAINLSPAGTITITNGVRTSIIMDEKNIQIACAGNIELKAGGTLSLSGRDVIIQAADNMEICSFFGAIVMKARTTFKALVEKGRLWFKSDMDPDDDSTPEYPLSDGEQPEVEKQAYSIIMDAPKGKILNYGQKGFVAATNEEEAHISLEASGKDSDVNIMTMHDLNFLASKYIKFKGYAMGVKSAFVKFVSSVMKIGEQFRIKGGRVDASIFWGKSVLAASHISKAQHVSKNDDLKEPEFDAEQADEIGGEADNLERDTIESKYADEELNDLRFEMPEWEIEQSPTSWKSYKASAWDDSIENTDSIEGDEYCKLNLQDTKLESSTRTVPTNLPWPGKGAQMMVYRSGPSEALDKPLSKKFTEGDIATSSDLTPTQFVRNYINKNSQ